MTNSEKTLNFTTKISLDFSKKLKNFQFIPENLSATISLSKLDFLRNKTATEIALLFYKDFYENYKGSGDSQKALFKTFSKFGGISLNLGSDFLTVLPSNYEIKPDLQQEKLVFLEIDDTKNSILLNMILSNKSSNSETNFSLKFVNFPAKSEDYGQKFLQAFSNNYELEPEIKKYLSEKNSKVKDIFQKKPSDLGIKFDFVSWFKKKNQETKSTFLNEVKDLFPSFELKNVDFKLGTFQENQIKNDNLIPINLQISGNFADKILLPAGLNLHENRQYSYNFSFNFDATSSINSSLLKKAIELFDFEGAKNPTNLNFELKKNLPVTIFASTIDDTIKELFNKPLDLKTITKEAEPLFNLLNFSVESKKAISFTKTKPVEVSATLFQEEKQVEEASKLPKDEKKPGDYLKSILENLAKLTFPPNTFVYLSSSFENKYTLKIEIKTNDITQEKLEIVIGNVFKKNSAYEKIKQLTKVHLFLDWQTNVETRFDDAKKQKLLTSISAIDNPNFKFVVGGYKSNSDELPFLDEKNQGIYLAEKGIIYPEKKATTQPQPVQQGKGTDNNGGTSTVNNSAKITLGEGISLFYAFKPTKLPRNYFTRYFLFKSVANNGKQFGLIVEPDKVKKEYNHIGPDFVKSDKFSVFEADKSKQDFKIELKWWKKEAAHITYNGKFNPIDSKDEKFKQEPENPINLDYDFLNESDSTVILAVKVQRKDGKIVLKSSFFTTGYEKGEKPKFEWEWSIPNDKYFEIDLSKGLSLGAIASKELFLVEKVFKTERSFAGITFKGFAMVDNPKNNDIYDKIFEIFRKEYI
ncbi:hypothetical protein [Mycoplasma sp. 'Moose RK']|uniref:hypothetical protein n=1 Tax=Mycoplasma sp. 'Moose RK' TaxID=2780095 RepID=UPI0018C1FBB5|nr:hypothetical protein [Mycoplasma sp. 'Moose RK']MBG0730666.1 hypothetical protein [Mycoplasma sp. 'Moose RK']